MRATFASVPGGEAFAALSPDGLRLAIRMPADASGAASNLWLQPSTGGGSPQPLLERTLFTPTGWSADGKLLVGAQQETETGFDVVYLPTSEPSQPVRFTTSRFSERDPALSPDGRWIAYQSNETGRDEVFASDFPKGSRRWQVSTSGGTSPVWRSDGRELYFPGPDGAMAVAVSERGAALEFGPPEHLPFPTDALALDLGVRSPDGKRFLVVRYTSEDFVEPIRLLRNWRLLLER
jgi:Tol biopolymer transport system component